VFEGEMKDKIKAVIEFLKKRYGAEVIIIVGSRAVGDHKKTSDWDIYIFSNKKPFKKTPQEFRSWLPKLLKEEDLDVYVNSFDKKSYPDKLWRDLRNSVVLLDKNNFGKKLREEVIRRYKKGPKKWTREYALWRIDKSKRYMKKFNELIKEKNYLELSLRIGYYFDENLIEWWFGLRREFRLRPQEAFPYIKKKAPRFYGQLRIIVSDKKSFREKINAIRKCNKILFESKEFKSLIK
jgi:predicted nucleotidyltransferase